MKRAVDYLELNKRGRSYFHPVTVRLPYWRSPEAIWGRLPKVSGKPAAASCKAESDKSVPEKKVNSVVMMVTPEQSPDDDVCVSSDEDSNTEIASTDNEALLTQWAGIEPDWTLLEGDEKPMVKSSHMRMMVKLNGHRVMAIIDTGADISLVSSALLTVDDKCVPWTNKDGHVMHARQGALDFAGKVALAVELGPVDAMASFVIADGVNLNVILSTDFVYEQGIAVSSSRHAIIFEHHDNAVFPLVGRNPNAWLLQHDVILLPGTSAKVKV